MKLAYLYACALIASACTSKAPQTREAPHKKQNAPFTWPLSYEFMPSDAVLIFSATSGWRHDNGIAGAQAFWATETDRNGTGLFITEDARVFSDHNLEKFSVIIMNSATGDVLSKDQQTSIENFVQTGGGLIALHAMGDSSLATHWPWWGTQFGTHFLGHPADPQIQRADVVTLATEHPVMSGIGTKFSHIDEWYSFTGPIKGNAIILAGLDESTYSPFNEIYGVENLRMGSAPSDHPIIWVKCPENGKVFYSALGHKADAYENEAHIKLLKNAMSWVREKDDYGCPK